MNRTTELMHLVLDGAATAAEVKELERTLAADPTVRAEFDRLGRLFDGLGRVPRAFPPEGLFASVMAALPDDRSRSSRDDQLYSLPGVIGQVSSDAPGGSPGRSTTVRRISESGPTRGGVHMSEERGGLFGKRKVWIGAGIVAAASVLAVYTGIDYPPSGKDATGTIVPAQRYRAPQNTADDVKLGSPSTGQSAQSIPASQAASASQSAEQAANRAVNQAADQRVNQAADQRVNQAADQRVNQAADQRVNQAADQRVNQAADQRVNQAADKTVNQAADQAVNQSANRAVNQTANQAVNQSANRAVNQTANQAVNQTANKIAQ